MHCCIYCFYRLYSFIPSYVYSLQNKLPRLSYHLFQRLMPVCFQCSNRKTEMISLSLYIFQLMKISTINSSNLPQSTSAIFLYNRFLFCVTLLSADTFSYCHASIINYNLNHFHKVMCIKKSNKLSDFY